MAETKVTAPGMFCWSEVGTIDTEAAKRFYAAIFGWETQDTDAPGHGAYAMLRLRGAEIGGMYEIPQEQRDQGVPPHWLTYVRVESVDDTAARVSGLDGNVVVPPTDIMDMGRLAVLQDPSGAVFAIWEVLGEMGGGATGPGTPCWYELVSSDRMEATAFYAALFGWKLETWPGEVDYVLFRNGEPSVAGAAPAPRGVPSHWLTYFAVEDADEAAARTLENGGRVVEEPHDIPGVGRSGLLADHAGAIFGVMQFSA
ncbi:VOC family protein [bacterium]|nr:VOC family protein [bacterium]